MLKICNILCDLSILKDIFDLGLTLILAVATVFLAVYTYRLVDEARKSRKVQVQPYISIHLEQAETDASLLFIIVKNIGQGVAYDLTFDIKRDILGNYGSSAITLGVRGTFKNGMRFCPPGYEIKHLLMETTINHEEKFEEELILIAKYKSILNEEFQEIFNLKLREHRMAGRVSPSDTHIGRIAEYLKEIKNTLSTK